jgi:hypothetical protein
VATRSEAWVCGRSFAGNAGSNPVVSFAANPNISIELRECGGGKTLPDKLCVCLINFCFKTHFQVS